MQIILKGQFMEKPNIHIYPINPSIHDSVASHLSYDANGAKHVYFTQKIFLVTFYI